MTRIKKTYRSAVKDAKVLNERSASQDNTYSCDYLNKRGIYSTEEVKTGETWIDGKPIYRKVIHKGSFSNLSTITATTDKTIDTVISIKFNFLYYNDVWYTIFNTRELNYTKSSGVVGAYLTASVSVNDSFFILEYTKKTD